MLKQAKKTKVKVTDGADNTVEIHTTGKGGKHILTVTAPKLDESDFDEEGAYDKAQDAQKKDLKAAAKHIAKGHNETLA